MAFQGWLVKFGDYEMPNRFLSQYSDTSNQRVEADAYRDTTALLHRETYPNYKSSIKLSFIPLHLKEMELVKSIIDSGIILEVERRAYITYWNSEDMDYKSGEFYIPDIEKTITFVWPDDDDPNLRYDAFDLELIEY